MEKLLIQISGCLLLFYGIYHISLRRLTFFEVNRWYLLASILLSILIPGLAPLIELTKPEIFVYQSDTVFVLEGAASQDKGLNFQEIAWMILKSVYLAGVGIALFRMLFGLSKIWRLYAKGEKKWKGQLHFVYNEEKHLPFSFLGSIYISRNLPLNDRVQNVILHEEVHVKRGHTFDILFTELAHAFFWFNPIFIFYKRALKASHEFIADHVVSSASDKYAYIQTLVGTAVSGIQLELTNQFFHSQIKKRLEMMNAHSSSKSSLGRYLMAIPLIMVLGLVFASAKIYTAPVPSPEMAMMTDSLPSNAKYFINNKPSTKEKVEELSPEIIQSVDVRKNEGTSNVSEIRVTTVPPPPPPPAPTAPAAPKAPASPAAVPAPPAPPAPNRSELHGYGESSINENGDKVFKLVDQMPMFPGCEDQPADSREACARQKLLEFIYTNVKYPAEARNRDVQGVAVVQFTVKSNGSVADVNILRNPGEGLGESAKAVVELMNEKGKKWVPGIQRGETVNVQYTLPIKFAIDKGVKKPETIVENVVKSEPGEDTKIRIRGTKSGSATPLYVVDGKVMEEIELQDVDPSTIESITVIKDEKKAVELYGVRGKDGVVEIYLKKGEAKKAKKKSDLEEVVVIGYDSQKEATPKTDDKPEVVVKGHQSLKLDTPNNKLNIMAYPNPAAESVNVEIEAESEGKAKIEILKADGSLISRHNAELAKGKNTLSYSLPTSAQNQSCFVRVIQGTSSATYKLVVH